MKKIVSDFSTINGIFISSGRKRPQTFVVQAKKPSEFFDDHEFL